MWSDNETNRDFLNFRIIAKTAAEMISQANGQPLSIGISGGWGVGKSSMMKLIQEELPKDKTFIFVDFNAWLYQGYDDARAALIEVIIRKLQEHAEAAEGDKTSIEKFKDLLSKVNWLRTATLAGGAAGVAGIAMGALPAVSLAALVGSLPALIKAATGEGVNDSLDSAEKVGGMVSAIGSGLADYAKGVIKDTPQISPPKQIQDLRDHFVSLLSEMKVSLVVLIDDLDRCLPETAISTLEAIRLFLFLENTAFVIAADDKMIRHAVQAHFKDIALDDDLVTNYFDKLIQIPLRVPALGTLEVKAYLMLLFIENSPHFSTAKKDEILTNVSKRLTETWKGQPFNREFMRSLVEGAPSEVIAQIDLADRLAPLMASSTKISGNPRLIKRFLNTLSIRLTTAKAQSVDIDAAVLAKLLLFERCSSSSQYGYLLKKIGDTKDGKPAFLSAYEAIARQDTSKLDLPSDFKSDFIADWLALEPELSGVDMRSALYISREHMPVLLKDERLSAEGAEILDLMMNDKSLPNKAEEKMSALPKWELDLMLEKFLAHVRQEQKFTVNNMKAGLTISKTNNDLAVTFKNYLLQLPPVQVKPAFVANLSSTSWKEEIFSRWLGNPNVSQSIKNAIGALA